MTFELDRCGSTREVVGLQEEINKLFRGFEGGLWAPPINVEETKDEIIVKVEIPGIKKEEIKIHVEGDTLVLTGERKREVESKDKTVHLVESVYGKFQRVLGLPTEVDAGKSKATYENGILTVQLSKAEQAKPKEISITVQ